MSEKAKGQGESPRLQKLFPDAVSIFSAASRSVDEVKDSCLVVLDTNVLLVPYTVKSSGLSEIERTYRTLAEAGRLLVPAQVAREYATTRGHRLAEVWKQLRAARSGVQGLTAFNHPLLTNVDTYQRLKTLEGGISEQLSAYRSLLDDLTREVRGWSVADPVSRMYGEIFDNTVVIDSTMSPEDIRADVAWRLSLNIPPGFKDAPKGDGIVGDVLIWLTLLEVAEARGVATIFVTGDEKPDWWITIDKLPVYPRPELIEEYGRRVNGQAFFMMSLAELLDVFGAAEDVVAQVRTEERNQAQHDLRGRIAADLRRGWPGSELPSTGLAVSAFNSGNAIRVHDGAWVVVRYRGNFGAIRPLRQGADGDEVYVEYEWRFTATGRPLFHGPGVAAGRHMGTASISAGGQVLVQVGPISLGWSLGGDGIGWLYFGPTVFPQGGDELVELTVVPAENAEDISLSGVQFQRAHGVTA